MEKTTPSGGSSQRLGLISSLSMGASKLVGFKKWEPPKHGFLKCNFDATIAKQNQRIGLGYIIHNEKDELIGAKNGHKT